MKRKAVVFVFLLANSTGLLACSENRASQIIYQDFISRSVIEYRLDERSVRSADVIDAIETCHTEHFLCLKDSLGFGFSVPRNEDFSVGANWSAGGTEYNVVEQTTRSVFGNSYDLIVIRGQQGDFSYDYYFNKDIGIIAIRNAEGGSLDSPLWILTGNMGLFGKRTLRITD